MAHLIPVCGAMTGWRRAGRGAFTLIELIMVMAVIAIVTAVTVPTFVQTIRGNRLRAAGQIVVRAGRYAWSMAVLNQKEIDVVFNGETATIDIRIDRAPTAGAADAGVMPPEEDAAAELPPLVSPLGDGGGSDDAEVPRTSSVGFEPVTRKLDDVSIEAVTVKGDIGLAAGTADSSPWHVRYFSNGRCTPYTVKIVDEFGDALTIDVDALGAVRTTRDRAP